MSFNPYWIAALVLGPLAGLAQSAPHAYVGVSAALVRTAPFESYADTRVGPTATIGVQLSRQWALETGALVTWGKQTISNLYVNGNTSETTGLTERFSTLVVPLLARYTFTPAPAGLHLDALGGVNWRHGSGSATYTRVVNGITYNDVLSGHSDQLAVTLGPQVRYSLGAGLDLKLSVPFNLAVTGGGTFRNNLFLTPQLGAQYTFGR